MIVFTIFFAFASMVCWKCCWHCYSCVSSWQQCLVWSCTVWQCQHCCLGWNKIRSASGHPQSPPSPPPVSTWSASSSWAGWAYWQWIQWNIQGHFEELKPGYIILNLLEKQWTKHGCRKLGTSPKSEGDRYHFNKKVLYDSKGIVLQKPSKAWKSIYRVCFLLELKK